MDRGRFRIGMSMLSSYINASHTVEAEQREPGVDALDQPARHVLDIGLLEWDLEAQLGVHRRLAFELLLPIRATIVNASFEDRDGNTIPNFASIHHRDETIAGVGDFVVAGRTALVLPEDVRRWTLQVRAGVSFPTGRIERDPFALGAQGRPHQHMFFGSGTFDQVMGVDTNIAFDRWTLLGWTVAKATLYANEFEYRNSSVVVGGIGAAWGFGLERWSFLLQPEVYFETTARWSGTPARNSGRTSLLATGGAFVNLPKGWQLHALAKIPYYTWARGGPLRWPFVAVLGFNYVFDVQRRSRPR